MKEKKGRPLLDYALRPYVVTPVTYIRDQSSVVPEMVEMLMDAGADPYTSVDLNPGPIGGATVFDLFQKDQRNPKSQIKSNEERERVNSMLQRGARHQVVIPRQIPGQRLVGI
jgi:hypothetical protein